MYAGSVGAVSSVSFFSHMYAGSVGCVITVSVSCHMYAGSVGCVITVSACCHMYAGSVGCVITVSVSSHMYAGSVGCVIVVSPSASATGLTPITTYVSSVSTVFSTIAPSVIWPQPLNTTSSVAPIVNKPKIRFIKYSSLNLILRDNLFYGKFHIIKTSLFRIGLPFYYSIFSQINQHKIRFSYLQLFIFAKLL